MNRLDHIGGRFGQLLGLAFCRRAELFRAAHLPVGERANQAGAIAGIVSGFGICVYYLLVTHPAFGGSAANQWFHIASISAGVFGVPAGLLAIAVVSLATAPPEARTLAWMDEMRGP